MLSVMFRVKLPKSFIAVNLSDKHISKSDPQASMP